MLKRARGALLRLAQRRWLAALAGLALTAPALWLELSGRYDDWWVDGVSLVLGSTGAALVWTGLVGVRPDWTDDGNSEL